MNTASLWKIAWATVLLTNLSVLPVCAADTNSDRKGQESKPASRSFTLNYGATLTKLPPGSRVRVWIPVPKTSIDQTVTRLETGLPAEGQIATEPVYGNRILSFDISDNDQREMSFSASWHVRRREVRRLGSAARPVELTKAQLKRYLLPNSLVPITGRPIDLLAGLEFSKDPLSTARLLYEQVDDHVRYDKSKPGFGNGDVEWVCDSGFGNCTDFHSLFISLARARRLPARFEIGLPLPPKRGQGKIGGYHCWAQFHTKKYGWVPVDISEADKHPEMKDYYFGSLTENRVTFTVGRDINLVPKQQGPPLNYFVYPYVEVDGKLWPRENIELAFSFRDDSPEN